MMMKRLLIMLFVVGLVVVSCENASPASGVSKGEVNAIKAFVLECSALKNSIVLNINQHHSQQDKLATLIQSNKELPTDVIIELRVLKDSLKSCQIGYMHLQTESEELETFANTFLTECSDVDRKVSSADYKQELDWQTGLYKELFAKVSAIVLNNSVYQEKLNALLASRQLTLY